MPRIISSPQKFDSTVRTITASLLALGLVAAMIFLAITGTTQTAAIEAVKAAGLIVVGFYFGGHVAQNTAALEEQRLMKTSDASEASAIRSEASAVRSERRDEE